MVEVEKMAQNTAPAARMRTASVWQRMARDLRKNKMIYLIALPMILYYIVFKYVPMYGIQIAFKDYNLIKGITASPWAGLKYFDKLVTGFYFKRILRNTFLLSFYGLIFSFPMPIIFALLLNEIRQTWYRRTVQTVTYMPHFVSMVVICGMIHLFCASDGLINNIINLFTPGREAKNLLMEPQYFRTIYILSDIWKNIGWNSILYIAAILGIDQSQYEAAIIDGASRWQQAIYITIPCMMPTIIIKLIFRMGDMMDIGFEKVFLLYNEATWEVSDVISTYSYRVGLLEMNYSFSTAISLFNTVINFVFLLFANAMARKYSETSLF